MDKKVIPFPTPKQPAGLAGILPRSRIIMQIGRQRIALDISCQVTELSPPPENGGHAAIESHWTQEGQGAATMNMVLKTP